MKQTYIKPQTITVRLRPHVLASLSLHNSADEGNEVLGRRSSGWDDDDE